MTVGVFDKSDLPTILSKIAEISPMIVAIIWDWYTKQQDAKHLQVAMDSSHLSPAKIAALAKDATLR